MSQIYLNYFEIKHISDNHIMSTECDKIDSRISDVPQLTQLEKKGKQLCVYQGLCPLKFCQRGLLYHNHRSYQAASKKL